MIEQIKIDEKKAVIWGSGSKCVSFLTTLSINDQIEYVIDINPFRQGRFIPGAGKQIMSPNFLKKYDPDITLVMNPIYLKEIKEFLELNIK